MTSVSNFLIPALPPSKLPTKHGKSSGCVLTSVENIHKIEEKESKKLEEERAKNERKLERLQRAKLKKELANSKAEKRKAKKGKLH